MIFALIFPVISICKWRTVLKWYMRLRREMKIRMFTKIARRSIANIVNIPGRIGYSLDDECLDIATVRRTKYANLLNLNKLSEKSSNKINFGLRISKSLTTLVTNDDSRDSNDTNDSIANDLSVAEKSMRMLGITAEDVMDACARIQERFYWSAQDEIAKTPEAMEEAVVQVSLEKDEAETDASGSDQKDTVEKPADFILKKKDITKDSQIEKDEGKDRRAVNDALRSKQTTTGVEEAADYDLTEEIIIRSFQIEREREEEDNKIDKKEQILIDKEQNASLTKSDVTSDRINNRVKSAESYKLQEDSSSRRKEREEEAERLAKMCPLSSVQCKNARNMEAKPCASLVRKLEAKLRPLSTNQEEKFDQLDRRKYPRVKLTPNSSNKNSRTSFCTCHRALKRNAEKGKPARSTDVDDKSVKHDRKEFKRFVSIINAQKDKMHGCGSAFRYSETYRLRKRIQKSEGSSTNQTVAWGSMSLAQTARPSGYARDAIAINKPPGTCQRNVQSEACDESIDSRSTYNASLTEKNYARSEKCETKSPEASDLTLLANKKGVRARRRQDLSPNRKLSSEEREAVELRALRAFNELTLLEDKKKLEAKRNRDSSLNYEQPRESEVPGMKVCKSDLALPEEQKEMNAIREHGFSSRKRSMEEWSSLKVSNEYTSEDKEELKTDEKQDSSRSEENVESSRSVSNHPSEVNREGTGILSSETRQAHTSLNLREITRNIEWTVHPRGIVLTNKNLHRQFLENERFHESQQRDIVDDNVASTLHSAFFFKPEIVTRVFRRTQARIGESLPSFPTFWREDFNSEFVCQVNNETIIQGDRDSSSFNLDLERITDRTNLGNSSFPDANRVAGEESRDLCIIFIDQEQASRESETAIIENLTAVRSQEENARSSLENIETTNILLVCLLRDFGIEVSEESVPDVIELNTEEYGDISNVVANFQSLNETNLEEDDNNRDDAISSHQQILIPNDSCPDDVGVTSSVNLLQRNNSCNLSDKSAINISSEKGTYENNSSLKDANNNTESQLSNSSNNNQVDTLINKSEKSVFNHAPENTSQLSSSDSPSFIKEDNFNQSMQRSIDEGELQRLTQLSDSEATLKNQRTESIMISETTNRDMISQFEDVEALNSLETMIQDDVRNKDENRDICEKANIFSTHRFSGRNQNERLQQDDSFYSMYERNHDGTETPISLGGGSLMEEFSNSTIQSSNASARNFQ